ncbi:polyphosphate kinase 2 [Synechococcus sp. UW179B]|jgi:polyphosphate kinase 2|uniref:polyphosphate kinase 2 n=1 Tax=Synechococcus sp. UW179B TaxID=2575516 RepID=UPI000E0E6FB7|nr:polyphosphate kinase 2 [Synechococcus sp. UW179B]
MGHKENKKSKHNGKSKETAQSNPSQPISDAVIDAVDRSQRNSDSSPEWHGDELERPSHNGERLKKKIYESELEKLQTQLVKMQYWIKEKGFRMIILFEGRDAAGKGGTIKRLTEPLNPRGARVVALGTPSDLQKTQWYFQRYVEHFPAAGEIVVFDRSWYNRAGVERVMGFCTPKEVEAFLEDCPQFERMLVRSGVLLLKYWFSVSDTEQENRFQSRIDDPTRRWKLSPMDLEARNRWVEFSEAKDLMFASTNIPEAPWFSVEADDKRRARLNCLRHILSKVPWEDMTPPAIELPPRPKQGSYKRPPINEQFFVPNHYPYDSPSD